jgi:hypothetical protein
MSSLCSGLKDFEDHVLVRNNNYKSASTHFAMHRYLYDYYFSRCFPYQMTGLTYGIILKFISLSIEGRKYPVRHV